MPNIGPGELLIILVIALIIFGPKRLPGLGRSLGSGMRQFKEAISAHEEDVTATTDPDSGSDSDRETASDAGTTQSRAAT